MKASELLCLIEGNVEQERWALNWLNETTERNLLFVDSWESSHRTMPLCSARAKYQRIDSPFEIEIVAKKVAWDSVFLNLKILGGEKGVLSLFSQKLELNHRAANLLLSDVADFGCSAVKNSFLKKDRPLRNGMGLKGSLKNIPAIVVGAGPSLEKNVHYVEELAVDALILTGGAALNILKIEPHFAASIDSSASYRDFKKYAFWETPFCFQSRMNQENFALIHGEAILFPDSHLQFLDNDQTFESGWTVGTFLVALATFMGCNPIVFVGMDLCYQNDCKYATHSNQPALVQPHLVKIENNQGKGLLTQPDWIMARAWLEEWATRHPGNLFIDATEGGIGFSAPIKKCNLKELQLTRQVNLKKKVHDTIQKLPMQTPYAWDEWKKNLLKCSQLIDKAFTCSPLEEELLQEEAVYERLLAPLWQMWFPLLNRTMDLAPNSKELIINRLLFFKQVVQEHLYAIE